MQHLDAAKGLLEEHVVDILMGFTICSNPQFRKMFKHLKQCADLGNMDFLETINENDPTLIKIESILDKAVDVYDKLCVVGQWIKLEKNTQCALTATVNFSWYCGAQGQSAARCPKPHDQDTFNKNKKALEEAKRSREGGSGRGGHSGGRGGRGGSGQGCGGTSWEYQCKAWAKMGLSMVDGSLKVNCCTCGLNSTHSTKFHHAWLANPSTFNLSADHPYVCECAKLKYCMPSPTAPSSAPTANTSIPGTGPAGNLISFDCAQLEQRITAFERESTNPNASDVSKAIRVLLLN